MDSIYNFGLEAIRWLQSNYPHLGPLMRVLDQLVVFELFLVVLPLLYWCFNKRLGLHLSYLLATSALLNAILKHILQQPRPYWLDADVGLTFSDGFSTPSAGVQAIALLLLLLAARRREGWLWATAFITIFLVALSRIYLGVHFVHDAVAGFLLAVLILLLYAVWQRYLRRRFTSRLFGQRLLAAMLFPFVLLACYALLLWLLPLDAADRWPDLATAAGRASLEEVAAMAGLLFGLGVGFTFEKSRVCFLIEARLLLRLLRYPLGLLGIVLIWRGVALLFAFIVPADTLWLLLPLRFVRYALMGGWFAYYAPLLFVNIGLAGFSIEPELPFTVDGATVPTPREESW